MKVYITALEAEQQLKTTGMQLDIYNSSGDERLGDLTITKTKLIWCAGKIHEKNGREATWAQFIDWMNWDGRGRLQLELNGLLLPCTRTIGRGARA